MTPPDWSAARELAALPRKEAARRLAEAAYRRAGELGARAFGVELPGDAPDEGFRLPDPASPPWAPRPGPPGNLDRAVQCPVCGWWGDHFDGVAHVELSLCPGCGANGRDRFLHWCLQRRAPLQPALRVIECSPRLGDAYRAAMATWFFYRTSDFDERAHRGGIRLDLQAIDLPDASLDVLLCAHVLEHVPDAEKALGELRRVMAPGGHLLLQVPVLQARTAPPASPEFHGDDTPVFWRFGFDLTARLRAAGFRVDLLCTQAWADAVASGTNPWPVASAEFDVPAMLAAAIPDDLVVVADPAQSARAGIDPAYMYLTWDCVPA
jgi:SAM-dependent methyltransferase